jgi:hypothetical protein
MSENVGASTSRNPKDLYGLYRDKRRRRKELLRTLSLTKDLRYKSFKTKSSVSM